MKLLRLSTYWEPQLSMIEPPRQRVRLVFQEADGAETVRLCDCDEQLMWQLAGMEASHARLHS